MVNLASHSTLTALLLVAYVQAKEFGEAEVWMNERLMRAAPGCFAEFLTAFEAEENTKSKGPEPLWLVWQYEGDYTLWDLMQKKDFPYNLEPFLLGQELDLPKGPQRKAVSISIVMQQVCYYHRRLLTCPSPNPFLPPQGFFSPPPLPPPPPPPLLSPPSTMQAINWLGIAEQCKRRLAPLDAAHKRPGGKRILHVQWQYPL